MDIQYQTGIYKGIVQPGQQGVKMIHVLVIDGKKIGFVLPVKGTDELQQLQEKINQLPRIFSMLK